MRKISFIKFNYGLLLFLTVIYSSCDNLDISSKQADSFVKLYGSWSSDIGVDVKTFNDEYIILATVSSSDENNTDIALIRTDNYGNQIDVDTLDNGGDDSASEFLLTNDGGFIVLGTVEDTATKNQNILLVKYNAQFEVDWQKTIGSSSNEQGVSIKNTSSGYVIAGNTDKADGVTGNPKGTWDIYLVKVDETGNLVWENNFGANGVDKASDIIVHNEGYLIVGTSNSFNESGQGGNDIIAIKTNFVGGETDKFTYGGNFSDNGSSVVEVSDGFVIVGTVENISGGNSDAYVLKVDKNDLQNILWNKSFGNNLNDHANDIIKTDEGFSIIGSEGSISGSFAYFLNIDSEGNNLFENTFGGYNQVLNSFEKTNDNGYIMIGSSGQEGYEQILLIKVNSQGELK